MKSDPDIRFFLRFGYFPGYSEKLNFNFNDIDRGRYQGWHRDELIDEGARLWRESIVTSFAHGERHVVPLSGGLDSRAILAALMECTSPRNIETYTFGTPGTLDFDLGCEVAKQVGTRHTAIRLDNFQWTEDDFVEAAHRFDHQTVLLHHAPVVVLEQFRAGVIWSGYLGDFVTGAHCTKKPSVDLKSARMKYSENRSLVKSMDISGNDPKNFLPMIGGGRLSSDFMNYDEQVLLAEVGRFTAPHVLMSGFHYRTPFINSPVWDFFLSIPDRYRRNQNLFKAMLRQEWPQLFSIPTKSNYGLALGASLPRVASQRLKNRIKKIVRSKLPFIDRPALPMTNYADLDYLLRKDGNLRAIVKMHLDDLEQRNIVPEGLIQSIWERHMSRRGHHADALKILLSLEMNLKGLEKQAVLGRVVGL